MKRLLVLAVLAGLAVAGTSCTLQHPAARVGGVAIPHSALSSQLQALTDVSNPAARCAIEILTGTQVQPYGAGQGTVPVALVDSELGTLVQNEAEGQALAARHITVTAADLTAARQDFVTELQEAYQQLSQSGGALSAACSNVQLPTIISQLPRAFVTQETQMLARQEKLQSLFGHIDVTLAGLRRYYASHKANFTQVCLNLLVADSAANAQKLHRAVTSGTSFAAAASNPAADPTNTPPGGQLRCVYPNQITSTFGSSAASILDNLPVGGVSNPVPVSSSSPTGPATYYLIAQMRQRHLVPLDSTLQSQLRLALLQQGNQAASAGISKILSQASVWIDPRYGSWNHLKQQILPPSSPRCSDLLNTSADPTCTTAQSSGALGSLGSLGGPGPSPTGAGG